MGIFLSAAAGGGLTAFILVSALWDVKKKGGREKVLAQTGVLLDNDSVTVRNERSLAKDWMRRVKNETVC